MTDNESTVKTTQTSLEMLSTIRELGGARTNEIVEAHDVAKSTAHKHLTTLERAGYLRKVGERYYIGYKFLNLGEYAREQWPWFSAVKEAVEELAERTEEECDFVVDDHGRVITVVESYHKWAKYGSDDGTKRYRANIGTYYPMHATGSGLAILASYPRDRVEAIVDDRGLPALTAQTITSRAELFEELDRIDERGYAVGDRYYTEGLRSVAKVVTGADGTALGAFSVSGPTYRIDGSVLDREIPRALADVVDSLESELADAPRA
ncbi:IclR family transcriptional regulator [Halobellus limi]|jgi:DNA-binding IclR family transcriptional regulator|uniref:IclR family transcriptional regulator n=1 Tax=Halobellus limi TaxID=699433 RepID=A0A1H6BDL6_9EURY|nr:IclR family transcriptional regulator [Halobellus limi]QCC49301.1 IclR family transcriptional regulator [Halobellus limi]SEG58869.1 transcriptional regulator, IclR family [Halobellus limi]